MSDRKGGRARKQGCLSKPHLTVFLSTFLLLTLVSPGFIRAQGSSLTAPTVNATVISSTQINLSWTASIGGTVDHYEVWRSANNAAYSQIGSPTSTSFIDNTLSAGVTYLYKVRAVDSGSQTSNFSNVTYGTTILFTDPSLVPGVTIVKAQHVTELRQGVDAVRASIGLSPVSWTDTTLTGIPIKAVHIQEIRTNQNQALTALGFSTPTYTDPTLTVGVTVVKAAHVDELRQTVNPSLLTLTPSTVSFPSGQIQNFTVMSAVAAGAAGLSVTLVTSGTGSVTAPSSVTIQPGQTSANFSVTGGTAGTVILTAAAPARQPASSTITVLPVTPTVTNFTPGFGPGGTTVTLTGTNFTSASAVTFNGVAAASFTVVNDTTLTATVSGAATTGPLAVTNPSGTGTSTGYFVKLPTPDFQAAALPATVTLPASGQAAFLVSVSGSDGFTGLAALSVTGLPTGMTAAFMVPALTAGQSTLLTLVTSGSTPSGTSSLTITATGFLQGVQTVRSVNVSVQVQAAGVTSLVGQVLNEKAEPVKGVVVTIDTLTGTTDDAGNYLILNPPVGANQPVQIDGGPASTPSISYPVVPYKVTIAAGQANTLGFPVLLPFQKTTGLVDISNTASQRVVTDSALLGYQMTLPAGVSITGWDGQPNAQVSIRRVPVDRTPLPPLPSDRYAPIIYMDYFGKQGGGTPSTANGIPITFPNDLDVPPSTQVELWYYDEAPDGSRPNQWAQYGTGTVSADGSQIIPDTNPGTGQPYGQPRFCCGAGAVGMLALQRASVVNQGSGAPTSPGETQGGEPIDLATGLFVLKKTDLVLPGRLPVVFTRTYWTNGPTAGPFGPGTSHSYNSLLLVQSNLRTLRLPNGNRILFAQQPDSSFKNLTDPAYQGAVLTFDAGSGTHTLRFKDGTSWTFGTAVSGIAFLSGQTDRNGNTITLARSGPAQTVSTITDSASRQIAFTYDTANRITAIQDPLGRTTVYRYDAQGRLATVTDAAGGVTRYSYDANGRMLTITDPRGITFLTNHYDSAGRVDQQTQADGGVWLFSYTTTNNVITETRVTDPRNNTTSYRFNGRGYLLSQTDPYGQTTSFTRDSATDQVLSSTDALGRVTSFEYDAAGNVKKVIDPDSKTTQFEYEATFNRVKKITDALNQVTEFSYDPANGNLLTIKDPLLHVTTIGYNAFGQPTSVTDPLQNPPTTFTYDTIGNLSTTTDPLGNVTQRNYDAVSRLVRLTDPRGFQTQFRYDDLNRVTELGDARQGVTRFTYDGNGNLLTVTDAKDQTTTYTYDTMDRLATRKDALNRQESYQYDFNGNLTQFTDRKSQQSTFTYDPLNRRLTATYTDSNTSFTYDAVGRLTRVNDSVAGAIDFSYDVLDRLILERPALGAVAYVYDAISRRMTMTVGGQAPVGYQYDAASRLTQVAQGAQAVGLGYDNDNRRTSLTYPNGTSATYGYDIASRLLTIQHQGPSGTIENLTYTYDAAGNRLTLTRANGTATLLPNAVQAAYDAANEQMQFDGATLTYDQNGNLTNDGTNTYTWDARNRLTGISGGVTASFGYDALGRRISKTVGGTTTQYLYDGNDIAQEIQSGAAVATYLRSLNVDELFGILRQDGVYFFIYDGLGSTLALTNQAATSAVQYSYEPFGNTQSSNPSFANPIQFTGRENDGTGLYYYRARYYSSLLHRNISEDPFNLAWAKLSSLSGPDRVRGVFFYRLLLNQPQQLNAYSYVQNNPLRFTDPYGLLTLVAGGGVSVVGPRGGVEGSGGLYLDTSNGSAGYFTAVGAGIGINASADVFGGIIFGDLQGITVNTNFVYKVWSVTLMFDPITGEFIGLTFGIGPQIAGIPPIGFSGTISATGATCFYNCPPPPPKCLECRKDQ